jgi:hypothetical protein
VQVETLLTHSLKATGFQTLALEAQSWFQDVPFKFNLRHYTLLCFCDPELDSLVAQLRFRLWPAFGAAPEVCGFSVYARWGCTT